MFTPDITIGTNTYALQSQRINSSVRSDASASVSTPKLLTISHEIAKNGKRSSVVIIDDTAIVSLPGATVPVADTIRAMFKVQYNPFSGRTDNNAVLIASLTSLIAFLEQENTMDKLLNLES